ncbi:MAG TPA: glycosyltransferase family A protein [Methylophilaceae bacterium]
MDITIGTSVWGVYDQFLPAWAESIAEQTVKPAAVSIADAGVDNPEYLEQAREIIEAADIPVTVSTIPFTGVGAARNAPFHNATTEWGMHLDADDTLLPNCIEVYASIADQADVIAPGEIRGNNITLFPHASRDAVLQARHSVLSCGAFRLRFWRRRPWQTKNPWVDTVFWIGLAHLGARIVPTTVPVYRRGDHDNNLTRTWTDAERIKARRQIREQTKRWTLHP